MNKLQDKNFLFACFFLVLFLLIGEIYLITVGTNDKRVFIFDIRQCPDIIHAGELWRILACHQMIKVMHDCRSASFQLKKEFGVHLQSVFDTQV